jgi:hypothetical protein
VRIGFQSEKPATVQVLPFLGEVVDVKGQESGSQRSFALPPIKRGAVACAAQ